MASEITLTDKQKAFALHYAATLNATESARLAGYKGNDATLSQVGYQNLRKLQIREAVDVLLEERTITAEEVLARLSDHARADIQDFIDPKTLTFDLVKAFDAGKSHLVKKIKRTVRIDTSGEQSQTLETLEFELHDSQAALVHLGRAYNLFIERSKQEHSGEVTIKVIRG